MILCNHCGKEVEDDYYNKVICRCKDCLKVYNHEQYIKHKESILARQKEQRKTPEGRDVQRKAAKKYSHTPKGREAQVRGNNKYRQTHAGQIMLKKAQKKQDEKHKLQRAKARVERLRARVAGLQARNEAINKARAGNLVISWAYLKTHNCLKVI